MSIFKACDIRGVYPDEINENKAYRIGRAVATMLDGGRVLTAGDVRGSTLGLKTALIDGLIASSCEVIDIGIVPTPVFHFARRKLGIVNGVMVTASHFPPEHNGLHVFLDGLPADPKHLLRIRAMIETNGFLSQRGRVMVCDPLPDYIDFITSAGSRLLEGASETPKVVIDCGNGCLSRIAPDVLDRLSTPTATLFDEPDGTFPNRPPDPGAGLSALRARVVEESADLGVAFDGDGDLAVFVDETGAVISANHAAAVIAMHAGCVASGDAAIVDIKCSDAISDVIRKLDAQPMVERSEHPSIHSRMIREQASLGIAADGHIFYRDLGGCDDGLYTTILMTAIAKRHGPLSRLTAAVPRYANTPDLKLRMRHDPVILDTIAGAFPVDRVCRLDGVRVRFEDGWGIARFANMEAELNLRFEGRDEPALERIVDEFLDSTPLLKKAVMEHIRAGC
jgi:phosphomannomutase/phosphoglucomutase